MHLCRLCAFTRPSVIFAAPKLVTAIHALVCGFLYVYGSTENVCKNSTSTRPVKNTSYINYGVHKFKTHLPHLSEVFSSF